MLTSGAQISEAMRSTSALLGCAELSSSFLTKKEGVVLQYRRQVFDLAIHTGNGLAGVLWLKVVMHLPQVAVLQVTDEEI